MRVKIRRKLRNMKTPLLMVPKMRRIPKSRIPMKRMTMAWDVRWRLMLARDDINDLFDKNCKEMKCRAGSR